MIELATGTLTFLFTDVEGSTPLWERHEATMRAIAARHDALLDALITQHHGRRVHERGEGDSIFAVFPKPADAVAAALAMTQAVLAVPWPAETPIRVRMGLHTGLAQYREGDYYGSVVNRCARIRGLGHGGQVLLSAATTALVRDALPAGAYLRSLGPHSLKGLSEPEEVFQLCHPDLPGEFPPLLSPQAPWHNLPQTSSRLIGREHEQSEVLALLGTERLVTLIGAGGVGKTRLALAVAAELVDQQPDGAWLVELAALEGTTSGAAALVPGAMAGVLGLREEPTRPILGTLVEYLKDKRLLLLLDNCEHLVEACAGLVSAALRACPGVRILATSREGLGVSGEQRYPVPSLTVPDPKHLPPIELVGSYEAVRLFVARAQARRRDFALDVRNGLGIARICARLDGIPLAIELAAARVGSLPVEAIADRLDDRFRLLTGGPRDAPSRQQTLRATIDWSWELLDDQEQRLLLRLSVFAGGWTLEAAEAVCAGDGIEGWAVLDLLAGLVNKSLVGLNESGEEARYGLLETVRQYAAERLVASGDIATVRQHHADYYFVFAEHAEPLLFGAEQRAWLDRLEGEHDNLRAALRWTQESGQREQGLRLAGALARFWHVRGYLREGRSWLEGLLAQDEDAGRVTPATRAKALSGIGTLAYYQGDYASAVPLFTRSLDLYRDLVDHQGSARTLTNLGLVARNQRDYERATALYEESLALCREQGDRRGVAAALSNLGSVVMHCGNPGRAQALLEESLAIDRELGDKHGIAVTLNNLGNLVDTQGDHDRAKTLYEESLALRRDLSDRVGIAVALTNLGETALDEGDHDRAKPRYEESLALAWALDERRLVAYGLEGMAAVAHGAGRLRHAAQLYGAAEALRESIGAPLASSERVTLDRTVATVRETLGEEAFAIAWAQGRAMPLAEAITLALEADAAH